MYHSRRKTQDSPSSFSHSNHHGPVVDFVQVVCRLKLGLYLLPENWAPVESKYQKLIRTIHVLLTLAMFRKMSPHSSSRKSGWSVIFSMGSANQVSDCRFSSGKDFRIILSYQNREVPPVGFRSSFRILTLNFLRFTATGTGKAS